MAVRHNGRVVWSPRVPSTKSYTPPRFHPGAIYGESTMGNNNNNTARQDQANDSPDASAEILAMIEAQGRRTQQTLDEISERQSNLTGRLDSLESSARDRSVAEAAAAAVAGVQPQVPPNATVETKTVTKVVKPMGWVAKGAIGVGLLAVGAGAYYAVDRYTDWLS